MRLSAFETYCMYLAIKQHFTSTYDFFKYHGKVNAKLESFKLKNDQYNFQKLSRKYDESEMVDFLVANFCFGNASWSGNLLDEEANDIYKAYLKRKQARTYTFQSDLEKIGDPRGKFDGDQPEILTMFMQGTISLETLIILDSIIGFKKVFDERLADDFFWPNNISRRMEKLKPFITWDAKKIREILKDHQESILNNA